MLRPCYLYIFIREPISWPFYWNTDPTVKSVGYCSGLFGDGRCLLLWEPSGTIKQQRLHGFAMRVWESKVTGGAPGVRWAPLLHAGVRTTGRRTTLLAGTATELLHTTSVSCFPNAYSSFPQQMSPSFLAVLLPLKTTPHLKCPARTFSRGQPLGLKC